ncbi:hypothetical protein GCM10020367_11560 [Streptomyces sannanensis]|uniref:DUF1579 domain-containing protein n=1 Tax=Streptomyces sannanensis TaxID=285536 RepID=A0ABP6S6D9_9ACTN
MTAPGISRERDRFGAAQAPVTFDVLPITGRWVNFEPATGIAVAEAELEGGRLWLRFTHAEEGQGEWSPIEATPLARSADSDEIFGFFTAGTRLPGTRSREVFLCGYLNRGLLVIDVYTSHPEDPEANATYRNHFYRPEGPPKA